MILGIPHLCIKYQSCQVPPHIQAIAQCMTTKLTAKTRRNIRTSLTSLSIATIRKRMMSRNQVCSHLSLQIIPQELVVNMTSRHQVVAPKTKITQSKAAPRKKKKAKSQVPNMVIEVKNHYTARKMIRKQAHKHPR